MTKDHLIVLKKLHAILFYIVKFGTKIREKIKEVFDFIVFFFGKCFVPLSIVTYIPKLNNKKP